MILACHNLNKSFGDHLIVRDGSFHVEDREKAALVGVNGAGKSTIFKMIVGELPLNEGDVILTKGKTLGYLAQHQNLDTTNTIYEELKTAKSDIIALEAQIRAIELELKSLSGEELTNRLNTYNRLMSEFESKNGYAYESEITGVLKGLGFTEEEFSKPTDTLSGGQKTRVSLGKLLLTKPDILLLDEPTNHLDLNSISWLETYLLNYPGAVLIVSHDRYFLDRVVRRIFALEDTRMVQYEGGYTDYANRKAAEGNTESTGTAAASQPKNADEETTSKNWKNGQKRKLKFTYQEQKDYESIEGEMAALEDKIATLEADFSKYASDFVKLNELTQEKEAAEQQLEEKMERWMYLEDLAARIERGEEN